MSLFTRSHAVGARTETRADLAVVAGTVGFVVAAALVGRALLAAGAVLVLPYPPLLAVWLPHVGPGTLAAVAVAIAVATRGPALAQDMAWRPLLVLSWAAAALWTASLALVDGWQRGVVERLTSVDEYLHDVPRAPGIPALLREFTAHIRTRAVDPTQTWFWTTHVGAHPPGAFLVFVVLDRVGLGGGGPAGLLVILVGASAGAAIAVAARALGDEARARRALPYTVLFPGAVWVGVSADGMFAGWLAWGVALLAVGLAGRGRRADLAAITGGLLLAGTLYLSYGLVLGGLLPLAVLAVHVRRTRAASGVAAGGVDAGERGRTSAAAPRLGNGTGRVVLLAVVSGAVVVAAFTVAGFSWFDGYAEVRVIYAASVAATRPYAYFVWANLAALAFALGPAGVAGLRRMPTALRSALGPAHATTPPQELQRGDTAPIGREQCHPAAIRSGREPGAVLLLVAAAMAAVVMADLSGMSKAEVERIWLPFAVWTALAAADLPHPRRWLVAQAGLALLVNHLLLTVW